MPAALEEFRGCNAGIQYVKLLEGGKLQDRTQLGINRTSTGKAGRQSYHVSPNVAINLLYDWPLRSVMKLLDLFAE